MKHFSPETIIKRIRARAEARRNGDAGLALLDILFGMAIFALIVFIAIQSFGAIRQRAFQTGATSDVDQIKVALEAAFTDNNAYPTSAGTAPATYPSTGTATSQSAIGVNLSNGNEITNYAVDATTGDFSFCVVHKTSGNVDAWAIYDSAQGKIAKSGRGTPSGSTAISGGYSTGTGGVNNVTCGSAPVPAP